MDTQTAREILAKAVRGTGLSSEDIRDTWPADIRRRSFFSARTTEIRYLEKLRAICAKYSNGKYNRADARLALGEQMQAMGTGAPELTGTEGGIAERGSIARLNLILDTNREMAASKAQLSAQTGAVLDAFPAWRLVRYQTRNTPRDWDKRWNAAGKACGWQGVARKAYDFVALKDSPIWEALGGGAGGFRDTLGNPFPPFAFNSGMAWEDVPREEAERLGLKPTGKGAASKPLSPGEQEIADAIEKMGPDFAAQLKRELGAWE